MGLNFTLALRAFLTDDWTGLTFASGGRGTLSSKNKGARPGVAGLAASLENSGMLLEREENPNHG